MDVVAEMDDHDRDDLWLVLPHLGPGGAQKVAVLAAEHFLARGWRVRIVTLLAEPPLAHTLPETLPWSDLSPAVEAGWRRNRLSRRGHRWLAKLVMGPFLGLLEPVQPHSSGWRSRLLRWCVAGISGPPALVLAEHLRQHRPRRVLALLSRTSMLCCSALWMQPCRLVVSERNDLRRQRLPFPWPRFRRLLYRRADVLTANTAGVLESLAPLFAERQLALLPNPLPMPRLDAQPVGAGERQGLVCVARLVHQKGLDVLIEALVSGEGALMTWPLTLVGDGPERPALERQVRDRRLAERVRFMGYRSDPQTFLQQAAVFVLPSRFEGMPNALLEAMAAGLAVVVTDASPGPLEVVDDGVTGLVVPSQAPQALAAALERLAVDPALRARLGAAAQTRLRQMDWSVVGPIWDQLVGGP
jgi:glycosyltransferase involved in cell wall biosynthesis